MVECWRIEEDYGGLRTGVLGLIVKFLLLAGDSVDILITTGA